MGQLNGVSVNTAFLVCLFALISSWFYFVLKKEVEEEWSTSFIRGVRDTSPNSEA